MSNNHKRFIDAGLPERLAKFATDFVSYPEPVLKVAVIPQGGGKGRLLVTVAKYFAENGGKVLFLTDRAILKEQYVRLLEQENVVSVNLERKVFRSIQAGAAIMRAKWEHGTVYVTTVQFAAAEDVKQQILSTKWDFVGVDDVRAEDFIEELENRNSYRRLLVTTGIPSDFVQGHFGADQIVKLGEIVSTPTIDLNTISYRHSEQETALFEKLSKLSETGTDVSDDKRLFRDSALRRRANSSVYALEITLVELKNDVQTRRNEAAHGIISGEKFASLQHTLEKMNNLLEELDELERESKFTTFLDLLKQNHTKRTIVYTVFSDTAKYLSQTLELHDYRVYMFRDGTNQDSFQNAINEFRSNGGVAVVSDPGRLLGIDFRSDPPDIILYDVPTNRRSLFIIVSRASGGKVFVLKEENDELPESIAVINNEWVEVKSLIEDEGEDELDSE